MQVKDVFEEIFVGANLSISSKTIEKKEVYTLKKDNIIFNSIFPKETYYSYLNDKKDYKNLLENSLQKVKIPKTIKEKYYIRPSDIIISIKKPYKVLTDVLIKKDIIVNNNYIILRGIDRKKYTERYLTYYLEYIGIKEILNETKKTGNELSLADIKNIQLPNISITKQHDIYKKITNYIGTILEMEYKIEKTLQDNK